MQKYLDSLQSIGLDLNLPLSAVWPDLAIFWTLGNFLKPLAAINLPKSLTFLGKFCKDVKIIHFSIEIIFGQLLSKFGDFYLVTLIHLLLLILIQTRFSKVWNQNFEIPKPPNAAAEAAIKLLINQVDRVCADCHSDWLKRLKIRTNCSDFCLNYKRGCPHVGNFSVKKCFF